MALITKDGQATPVQQTLKTTLDTGEHVPHHRVDGSVAVTAASLPLPAGAATEASLAAALVSLGNILTSLGTRASQTTLAAIETAIGNLLTTSGFQARIPANGQAAMAASVPVAIASNQSAVPVSAASLPLPTGAATQTTLADALTALNSIITSLGTRASQTTLAAIETAIGNLLTTSAFQARIPANGQAAMAASVPVTIASNQSAVPVSAASLPLPAGAATEASLAALLNGGSLVWVPDRATNASFAGTAIDVSRYKHVWLEVLLSDTSDPDGTFQVLGGQENDSAKMQPLPLYSGGQSLLIHGQPNTAVVHLEATPKTITIVGANLTAALRLLIPIANPPPFLILPWTRTNGGAGSTGLSMTWTGR